MNLLYHRTWWIEGVTVAAILFIVAIVFTWPLAQHLGEAIPAGSEPAAVAYFQLFTFKWTGQAIDEGKPYWDAPFFYPFRGVFAWCEPQPFTSVLVWLTAKLTGYLSAYNGMVLLYLAGFGLSGYAIARLLTEDRISALWSGVWLTGGAYSLQQICAPALIASMFPCACLYFIFLHAKQGRNAFFWLAVLSFTLTWLTCKQTAFFFLLLLPITLFPFFTWHTPRWPSVVRWLCALFFFSLTVFPYSLRQLSSMQAMGFQRELAGASGVFRLKDLFIPAYGHWLVARILGSSKVPGYYSWDVGCIALLVIGISVLLGIVRLRYSDTYKTKIVAGLAGMAAVALFLGFGQKMGVTVGGRQYSLYGWFFSIIPGFTFIRSPARFGLFLIFGVSVLAAPAMAYIRSRIKDAATGAVILSAFFLFLFAEMWTMPIPLVFPDRVIGDHLGLVTWLKEHGDGQPVLELPLSKGYASADMQLEAEAMLRMLAHRHPIVNGYASYYPGPIQQLKIAFTTDPAGLLRRYLEAYGVRYAVVHAHTLSDEQNVLLQQALGENVVYADSDHAVYALPAQNKIQDVGQFLPGFGRFLNIPQEDKIYALPLTKAPPQALLLAPKPDWRIEVKWTDALGRVQTKKVRMVGSILLDAGQERFFFEIMRFPKGKAEAEAKLISAEKGTRLLKHGSRNVKE